APVSAAAILNQLDQLDAPDNAAAQKSAAVPSMNSQPAAENPVNNPPADPALFRQIAALPGQQRVLRLQSMQPEEFDAFFKSLRPIQRKALDDGLPPDLREAVADLENP